MYKAGMIFTDAACKIIESANLNHCQTKETKNVVLKEIRQRGFQHKKLTNFGIKTNENIKFGKLICELNGEICTTTEFDVKHRFATGKNRINDNFTDDLHAITVGKENEAIMIANNEALKEKTDNKEPAKIDEKVLKASVHKFIANSLLNKNTAYIDNHKRETDIEKPYFTYYLENNLVLVSESKSFRKGCRSNVELKLNRRGSCYFLGIYSTRYIYAKEEIILPFDTINKDRGKCTCTNLEYCLDIYNRKSNE